MRTRRPRSDLVTVQGHGRSRFVTAGGGAIRMSAVRSRNSPPTRKWCSSGLTGCGLDLDDMPTSEGQDARQPIGCRQRRQRKEEVDQAIAASQPAVHEPAVDPVEVATLAGREREIPPHEAADGEQALDEEVRAEVHVVVPVEAHGIGAVQATELGDLGADHVFESAGESRLEDNRSEAIPGQIPRQDRLLFDEAARATRRRPRSGEVQMKAGVDAVVTGDARGTLRIGHEHHGAHGRDGAAVNAVHDRQRRFRVADPVVGIDDQQAAPTARDASGHGGVHAHAIRSRPR